MLKIFNCDVRFRFQMLNHASQDRISVGKKWKSFEITSRFEIDEFWIESSHSEFFITGQCRDYSARIFKRDFRQDLWEKKAL